MQFSLFVGLMLLICCASILYPLKKNFKKHYLHAFLVLLLVPSISAFIYIAIGSPEATTSNLLASEQTSLTKEREVLAYNKLTEELKSKLNQNPNNPQGWSLLARSYTETGQYLNAIAAFERAIKQSPTDASLLTDYADVLATFRNDSFNKKAKILLKSAINLDAKNVKARMIIAAIFFEEKNYLGALSNWEAVLSNQQISPDLRDEVKLDITETKKLIANQQSGRK